MKIAGIILAGGLSRRMGGQDKSLIELGGKSLISHCIDRLHPQVSTLAINANGDPLRFDTLSLPVIADVIEGHAGPLAGVHAGMQWAAKQNDITHILTAAADTPFFPTTLANALASSISQNDENAIAMAKSNDRLHPVFALWPIAIFNALDDFLINQKTRKVLAFTDQFMLIEVSFDKSGDETQLDPFFNINTAEDLETAGTVLQKVQP